VKPTIVRGFDYQTMSWADAADAAKISAPPLAPADREETLSPAA